MDAIAFICAFISIAVFANTWQAQFVYDDSRAIIENEDLRPTTPWLDLWSHDFWGTPLDHRGSHKSWRPFCVLSFRLNYYFSGLEASSYHVVNIVLHAVVTFLFVIFIRPFIVHDWIRCITGLAFAVHPIHCEATASIVGRAELGMALHILLALLAYRCYMHERDVEEKDKPSGPRDWSSLLEMKLFHGISMCSLGDVVHFNRLPTSRKQRPRQTESSTIETYSPLWNGKWKCRLYLAASLSASTSAILWKETGITAIPLCMAMELTGILLKEPTHFTAIFTQKRYWKRRQSLSWLLITASFLVAVRLYMLSGSTPSFAVADNPMAHERHWLTRTLTFLHLPVVNIWLLLWPAWLSFDWSMDAIRPIREWSDIRNVFSLLFYCLLAALLLKISICRPSIRNEGNYPPYRMVIALALLTIPYLPASNLFFYVGFVVAERILYLPSMGFCLLLACGLENIMNLSWMKSKKPTISKSIQLSVYMTLIFWSIRTIQRNGDWSQEERLYQSAIVINPAKAYGNLAAVLARQNRETEAEYAYRKALQYRPNMAETHFNLAVLLENQNRDQEAMSSYLQSIHYRPNLALAYLNLGLLLAKQGHYDQACHWLRSCTQLSDEGIRDPQTHRKTKTSALHQWGRVEASRGRHDLAIQLYQQALRTHPTNNQLQMLYNSLGESYQAMGDIQETEKWYRMALHVKPDHVASHLTYARLLAKNISRQDEAEQLFLKAQLLAPTDSSVYMLTGQFLLDISRPEEAAECFIRAAHLSPGDFEAVFNAATTLREIQQMDQAEIFYRRAVLLKPNDVTVYRNLGAMLHVNGKWHEAEYNYLQALKIVPDDHVTLINLKRLYQVMKAKGITPRHRPSPCPSGS